MTDDRANIKVSREFYERHKERKAPGQTWEEYIEGQAPDSGVDTDELARKISKRIDYAGLAGKTAEEIEGRLR